VRDLVLNSSALANSWCRHLRTAYTMLAVTTAIGCQETTPPHPTAPTPESASRTTIPSPERDTSAIAADSDWVRTPAGEFHRSCVHEIPDGAVVDKDSVRRRDDTSYLLPVCKFAARLMTIPLDMLSAASLSSKALRAATPSVNSNGWVERVWANSGPYRGLSADWTVPNNPSYGSWSNSKVYFTFPGLMNDDWILQPVLQYGRSAYAGGDYWTLMSYRCNTVSCNVGSAITATAGNAIHGDITASNCSSTQCLWTVITRNLTTGQASTLLINDVPNYTTAISGVVEEYGIQYCGDLPALTGDYRTSGVFYTGVAVRDALYNPTTPPWAKVVSSPLTCLLSVDFSATTASLRQSPQFSAGIFGPTNLNLHQSGQYTAWLTYGAGPYVYQWRQRTSANVPPNPYAWSEWSPWYFSGSTNYTVLTIHSCNVRQVDLQLMATDTGDNGGSHTATVDNYIAINNPC
jgi:hypothetical protein